MQRMSLRKWVTGLDVPDSNPTLMRERHILPVRRETDALSIPSTLSSTEPSSAPELSSDELNVELDVGSDATALPSFAAESPSAVTAVAASDEASADADELMSADEEVERVSGVNQRILRTDSEDGDDLLQSLNSEVACFEPAFELTTFIGQRWGLNEDASTELLGELLGSYVSSSNYEISVLTSARREQAVRDARDPRHETVAKELRIAV